MKFASVAFARRSGSSSRSTSRSPEASDCHPAARLKLSVHGHLRPSCLPSATSFDNRPTCVGRHIAIDQAPLTSWPSRSNQALHNLRRRPCLLLLLKSDPARPPWHRPSTHAPRFWHSRPVLPWRRHYPAPPQPIARAIFNNVNMGALLDACLGMGARCTLTMDGAEDGSFWMKPTTLMSTVDLRKANAAVGLPSRANRRRELSGSNRAR